MNFEIEIKGRTLLVHDATFEPAQRSADSFSPHDPPELTIKAASWEATESVWDPANEDDTFGHPLTSDEIDALLDDDAVYLACVERAEEIHERSQ
jgi:hypothetical protein